MDRTERFYRIDRLLRSLRVVTLDRFLKDLEVSRATFKRDLEYLRDRFRAPIVWDAEAGGYRYEGAGAAALPGFWLSPAELHAMISITQLLESLGPGLLSESLAPLKTRIGQALGETPRKLREFHHRVKLLQTARRPVAAPHFSAVASALLQRRCLQLVYAGRERAEQTERRISPQRLVHYRDNWYLDAWCHLRQGLRSFSLDAMVSIQLLPEEAKEIPAAELDRFLSQGYGIFGGEAKHTAVLRFSAERARWVSRESWHPRQDGRFDDEGRYVLKVPYSDARELLMDVQRHLPEVEVVSPAALRESLRQRLAGALAGFTSG